ncbi:MAG TPA: hypothetical protein P5510_06605 [Clostridia bacterium]|nr:hypothetical protein [Clostridia bacterium]
MTENRQGNWLKIKSPADLEKALARMMNKILMDEQPLVHAGQFASLANAWTNAHRVLLEEDTLANIKQRLDILEGKA